MSAPSSRSPSPLPAIHSLPPWASATIVIVIYSVACYARLLAAHRCGGYRAGTGAQRAPDM
eukprot:scaffold20513_cov33-Tisochrysis_lutea.AAC.4